MHIGEQRETRLTDAPDTWYVESYDLSPSGDKLAYILYQPPDKSDAFIGLYQFSTQASKTILTSQHDPGLEYDIRWLGENQLTYNLQYGNVGGFSKANPTLQNYWTDKEPYRPIVLDLASGERLFFPEAVSIFQSPDARSWLTCKCQYVLECPCDYWLKDLSSGNEQRVALNAGWGKFIGWSPDGRLMLFSAFNRTSGQGNQLLLVDTTTYQEHFLTLLDRTISAASWSPDGKDIAYSLCDLDGENCQLWLINRNRSQNRKISLSTLPQVNHLIWSPDGARLLFNLGYEDHTLWSIKTNGNDLRPVLSNISDCRLLQIP